MAGKKGMNVGKKMTPAQKDAIAVGLIESVMDAQAHKAARCVECGKDFDVRELTPSQVALIKARYDKLRPSLSTIEQHNIDDRDRLTDAQVLSQLHSLIVGSPGVVDSLLRIIVQADPGAIQRVQVPVVQPPEDAQIGQITH